MSEQLLKVYREVDLACKLRLVVPVQIYSWLIDYCCYWLQKIAGRDVYFCMTHQPCHLLVGLKNILLDSLLCDLILLCYSMNIFAIRSLYIYISVCSASIVIEY